jgi:hypothetical protein
VVVTLIFYTVISAFPIKVKTTFFLLNIVTYSTIPPQSPSSKVSTTPSIFLIILMKFPIISLCACFTAMAVVSSSYLTFFSSSSINHPTLHVSFDIPYYKRYHHALSLVVLYQFAQVILKSIYIRCQLIIFRCH